MSYTDQDAFFEQAYRTGTDRWTNTPFMRTAEELELYLPKGSMILDVGAGRGRLSFSLHSIGFHVIGLEKNPDLVRKGNEEIKNKGIGSEMRFLHGDALAMPLADSSFNAVVAVGFMHHLLPSHHDEFLREVFRVLKNDGFLYLVVLSSETERFYTYNPKHDGVMDRVVDGVRYHFFTDEEIRSLCEPYFSVRYVAHETPHGNHDMVYSVVLLRKK